MKTQKNHLESPKGVRPPVGSIAASSADVPPATREQFEAMEAKADVTCDRLGIPLFAGSDAACAPEGESPDYTALARELESYMAKHAPASPSPAAPTKFAAPIVCTTGKDNKHIVSAAKARCGYPSERGTFAPYLVIVDGGSTFLKSEKALESHISSILSGSKCRVFRNGGHGATVDFDNIDSAPAAPCPSASHLPLVPPVGVTDAPEKALLAGFMSSVRGEAPQKIVAFKTVVPAPVSPSLPAESPTVRLLSKMESVLSRGEDEIVRLKADVERLTGALQGLLNDQAIKDTIWLCESKDGDKVDDEDARTMEAVSAARSALSLAEVGKH